MNSISPWQRLQYVWSHPANRRARVKAVAQAIGWQVQKRFSRQPRELSLYNGMRLRCYPDSQSMTLALYTGGWYDWHEMGFMRHYLRAGDHFLDVGANVGIYSLLAASLIGPVGRVDAFEPAPESLVRLRENIALSHVQNVEIHEVAVGEAAGSVRFAIGCDALNHILCEGESADQTIEIPVVKLDEVLRERNFAMAKIDIEGAEPIAFCGASNMFARQNPPVWLLELNGRLNNFGYTERKLAAWLADQGYGLAIYDADRRELDFSPEPWLRRENVLAIAHSAVDEVNRRIAESCT